MGKFLKELWEYIKENSDCMESDTYEDFMEIAEKHGVATKVEYDSEIHGEITGDPDPGDTIWIYKDKT